MVIVPKRPLWPVLIVLIMLFSTWGGTSRAEEGLYRVEGGPVRLYMERFSPGEGAGVGSTSSFTLIRIAEDDAELYYYLTDLVSEKDHAFPKDMLVVTTPYDGGWHAFTSQYGWSSSDDPVRLLDARELSSEICVGLKGHVNAWAGTYEGWLYSDKGPDIPIEVVVPRSTIVTLDPDTIHVSVDHGPGAYEFELKVWVDVNYDEWVVALYSDGLIYQGDKYSDVPPMQLYLSGDEVPLSEEGYIIDQSGEDSGSLFTIKLKTEATWKHPAGRYEGTIIANVHGNE